MTHECDDCGQTFGTLTRLRLHDCSPSSDSRGGPRDDVGSSGSESEGAETPGADEAVSGADDLDDLLDDVEDGDYGALHEAVATYETTVTAAIEADGEFSELRRTYRPRLVAGLDDGVAAIPGPALEYFEAIRRSVGEYQDYVREGLHPYGWGIGHPDYPVAERIHEHGTEDVFLVNPFLEHAFYADQYAAIDLLERVVADDSVASPRRGRDDARYLLDSVAGAASDEFWPTIPRYWDFDWEREVGSDFELDEEVVQRARTLVVENGVDEGLPSDWDLTDLAV